MSERHALPNNLVKQDPAKSDIDSANSSFWSELCGSALARRIGVKDSSAESLKRFDDWYFDFYPYLLPFVAPGNFKDRRVLEVGLGYGSLSQKIAESGARFTGLDIAPGPVAMVNHRLAQSRLSGEAIEGSVLKCPFPDQSFDVAVAIGSLHHTGSLVQALRELHRVIVPGGQLFFMVYNALSYRRWARWPVSTLQHARYASSPLSGKPRAGESERKAYDVDAEGNAAPETEFFTVGELRGLMSEWSVETVQLKNIGDEGPLRLLPRSLKLMTMGSWAGLDIYLRATRR